MGRLNCLVGLALLIAAYQPVDGAESASKDKKNGGVVLSKNPSALSTVYVIKQESRQGGKETLYVSDKAVRIVQENAGRWTLASAPDWNPIVLNTANHTYCEAKGSSRNLLMQRYMLIEGGDLTKCKWKSVEKAKIASIDAERLVDANCVATDEDAKYDSTADELKICGFWVAANLKISPGAANLVARIRGCPQIGRLPLRFIHITRANRKTAVVDTFSCETRKMPLATMSIPAGYKRTLTEYDGGVSESGIFDEPVPRMQGGVRGRK